MSPVHHPTVLLVLAVLTILPSVQPIPPFDENVVFAIDSIDRVYAAFGIDTPHVYDSHLRLQRPASLGQLQPPIPTNLYSYPDWPL